MSIPPNAVPPSKPYKPFPPFEEFAASVQFDGETLRQFVAMLDRVKSQGDSESFEAAIRTATKWAAVDTGAIEGLYEVERSFTFSVAAGAAAWNNIHLVMGESAERAIHDALEAYDTVLDAVTHSRPITQAWVRELHAVICASQDEYTVITDLGRQSHDLPKGEYKKFKNNPFNIKAGLIHSYAPVLDTPAEMARLVSELGGKSFADAHPVLQAAYSHYAFVCIHPFADGNGRVSRALASVYLYRSPGVPLVIFADQKNEYIDALEAADDENYQPFVAFVSDRAVDVVRMVVRALERPKSPSIKTQMALMQEKLLGRGGLTHPEVDGLASVIIDAFSAAYDKVTKDDPLFAPVKMQKQVVQSRHQPRNSAYRSPPNSRSITITVSSAAPATAQVSRSYTVWIAKGSTDIEDFILVRPDGTVLEQILIRDVHPTVNPSLAYRLQVVAEDEYRATVSEVVAAAEQRLRSAGY
ncbi:Fic family protein [Phycicoccus flavus]|uniref:Fic family protein n=1 Tax=Phycicoccus flavus TaxID=2502783 RepID=UPI000FEBE13C|nr:Fic family protein [Phycicoccus flavus]NHA68271.1 Fic family protein [Phycicoccus flavus]